MCPAADEQTTVIGIAGSGAVGRTLGRILSERGVRVACVASRARDKAEAAAAFIGPGVQPATYDEIRLRASHLIVAVPDRAITSVAEEIASGGAGVRVALHTCGSYGEELLEPLRNVGASCGGFHPLQTFAESAQDATALRGVTFGVCGDPKAVEWAEEVARLAGGSTILVESGSRPLYHAAAVMASNYIAAVLDSAEHLMALAGFSRCEARRALEPLVRASVDNVFTYGALRALTGPIARGDAETVARHLQAMQESEGPVAELYKSAGLHTLSMARRRGLGDRESQNVRRALQG